MFAPSSPEIVGGGVILWDVRYLVIMIIFATWEVIHTGDTSLWVQWILNLYPCSHPQGKQISIHVFDWRYISHSGANEQLFLFQVTLIGVSTWGFCLIHWFPPFGAIRWAYQSALGFKFSYRPHSYDTLQMCPKLLIWIDLNTFVCPSRHLR